MSASTAARINLPPAYELVTLLPGGHVLEDAVRRAAEGADEGTLIWSPPPVSAGGSSVWPGELDCALILRPEEPLAVALQLVYVAGLSIEAAMTAQVLPMTRVRLHWPNTVQLNHCQAVVVTPKWAIHDSDEPAWLVLHVRADIAADRRDYEMPEYAEDRDYTVAELLERFGRHFLSNVNRWTDEGFEITRKAWLRRADGIGESIQIDTASGALHGIFETVNGTGELVLRLNDGNRRCIAVADVLSVAAGGVSEPIS